MISSADEKGQIYRENMIANIIIQSLFLVSFDFGPRFTNNENDDIIETLFAMDTNGEIYFSTYCGDLTW